MSGTGVVEEEVGVVGENGGRRSEDKAWITEGRWQRQGKRRDGCVIDGDWNERRGEGRWR